MDNSQDLKNVKVGDVLFTASGEEWEVTGVWERFFEARNSHGYSSIPFSFSGYPESYEHWGRILYWQKPEFWLPVQPKKKVKRSLTRYVNIYMKKTGVYYPGSDFYESPRIAKACAVPGAVAMGVSVPIEFEVEE